MSRQLKEITERCLRGAENDTMTFPLVVQTLSSAGVESYSIDFRKAEATYYLSDGHALTLPIREGKACIAAAFDPKRVNDAVKEAQALLPGYTYQGFCKKVRAAGCAGYMVSFSGRRAVYFGRTGETHTELFPGN